MGCPSEVKIGNNLVFGITTHDPTANGALTDADSAPTYRIYEDETGTAILTGTMAKLDDANTTGFYSELIACTAGNGFEDAKTYTIYIEATVNGNKGGITFSFKARTRLLADVSNLDAAVSSRSSHSASQAGTDAATKVAAFYTAPDNTNIGNIHDVVKSGGTGDCAAIKAKSDSLAFTAGNVHAHVKVSDVAEAGVGAITFIYTLTSSVDATPIPDADVWVTTDVGGTVVVASGRTDQNGQVTFYLDAGTVYVWRQKSGWDFVNPDTEVIS